MENKDHPEGYEEVKYYYSEGLKSKFEIVKHPEYDKTIPQMMESIDNYNLTKKETENYPYFTSQNSLQYLPKLNIPSDIFSIVQLKELHSKLPYYHQYTNLKRIFSISVDGCALRTFYSKCEGISNSVLVVKDNENNIFGAYASDTFSPQCQFYGTGECFLFSFFKENRIHVYNSTGKNDHYMYCDHEQICFGCSDDYFSLALTNDFLDGYSKETQTYDNECLTKSDKFTIVKLELWGFEG